MKNKVLLCVAVFVFCVAISKGQQEYMVGTSTVSIEPDSTVFSIALSIYGSPAEGRFSINWTFIGNPPGNFAAITGLGRKFFATDSNRTLWSGTPSGESILWKKTGRVDGIKALAGMDGKLYAVNATGVLSMTKIGP